MSRTSSPWTWRECGYKHYELSDGDGNFMLAVKWGEDEVPENVRNIIAAAPDLLEALKLFVSGPESRFIIGYHSAMEAIAKAEGR